MYALHDLLEPGLPATSPALQPLARAVLDAARADRLEALTGETAAAAVVMCTAEDGARLLEAHLARDPVTALEVALAVCRLHLRLALVNGALARVLERPARKPSSTLPAPGFWRALRRALDAAPTHRSAAQALADAAELSDLRVRAAVAFAVPGAALWTAAHHAEVREALSSLDPVEAGFFLLGLLRHAAWASTAPQWPPPGRALRDLPDDVVETALALVGDHAALERLARARAVAEAAADPAPLIAAPLEGEHLLALARVAPDADAIALAASRLPSLGAPDAAVLRAVLTGWVLAAPAAADEASARTADIAATVEAARRAALTHLPATLALASPWAAPRARPSRGAPAPPPPPAPPPGRWATKWTPPLRPARPLARAADAPREDFEQLAAAWQSGHRPEVDTIGPLLEALGPAMLPAAARWTQRDPQLLPALAAIDDAALAPSWVLAFSSRRRHVQQAARDWLEAHPRLACFGGLSLLWSTDAAERRAARRALRWLEVRHALAAQVTLDDAQQAWVDALRAEVSELPARAPALPDFLSPETLPGVAARDGRQRLDTDGVRALLTLAKACPLDDADALLAATARLDDASLSNLAGAVFTRWLAAGGPPKERWAMQLLAHVPSDDWATALGALCLRWAQSGFPGRAQDGVAVLARVPSRAALSEVQRLSTRVRTRALRAKAAEAFEDAALRLGLSQAELEDRLVPDFGLTDGRRLTDELEVDLDVALKPVLALRGARVKSPPAGTSEEARACWAAVKKGSGQVKAAALRLERLMSEDRALPAPHFTEVWLMHPLLSRIAERVAWAAFAHGRRSALFLTSPLRTVDGAPFRLDEAMSVRPVHPLELSDAERAALAAHLPAPAFPQLERDLHQPADLHEALCARVGAQASAAALIGLERTGWRRGPTVEGACYVTVQRRGPGWRVELEFEPGVLVVEPTRSGDQRLVRVHLDHPAAVSPVARSELLRQLPFSR